MTVALAQRIHRVTASTTIAAFAFAELFDLSKHGPFRDINPFGDDPYDAIGTLAIQIAVLVGIVTYARALRLRETPAEDSKVRLILRGNIVVLASILVTLVADSIAEALHPFAPSYWGNILLAALASMLLFALVCVGFLIAVFWRVSAAPPPNLTPADGLDDLLTLVRVPVKAAAGIFPPQFVAWVQGFTSDRFFARFEWFNPRRHSWRFACATGFAAGLGLALAHLQEGLPPSLAIGLFIAGIFIAFESAATLLGFAFLGNYLGLRPPVLRKAA